MISLEIPPAGAGAGAFAAAVDIKETISILFERKLVDVLPTFPQLKKKNKRKSEIGSNKLPAIAVESAGSIEINFNGRFHVRRWRAELDQSVAASGASAPAHSMNTSKKSPLN